MPSSEASHLLAACRNEEPITSGGDDFGVDVGPGVFFVGVDMGDAQGGVPDPTAHAAVCAGSDLLEVYVQGWVDRGDLPRTEAGDACAVDVLGGPCEVDGFEVWMGDGDDHTVQMMRQGTPADGTTTVTVPGGATCVVAAGSDC